MPIPKVGNSTLVKSLVLTLLASLATGLCIGAVAIGVHMGQEQRRLESTAQTGANAWASALTGFTQGLQNSVDWIAAQPRLTNAANLKDEAGLAAVVADLNAGLDASHSAVAMALGPRGIAAIDFDSSKLHNNIEINQVSKAFRDKGAKIEIHHHENQWLLSIASAIRAPNDSLARGVVLVRLDLDKVIAAVGSVPAPEGSIAISSSGRQRGNTYHFGDSSSEFVSPEVPISKSEVVLTFSPGGKNAIPAALPIMLLVVIVIGTLLLIAISVIAYRSNLKSLHNDVDNLIDMVTNQRRTTATIPKLANPPLGPVANKLLHFHAGRSASSPQASEPEPQQEPEEVESHYPTPIAALEAMVEEVSGDDDFEAALANRASPQAEATEPLEDPGLEDSLELELSSELPAEIFRRYDIRGQSELLDDELVYQLGLAIGSEARARSQSELVVGSDGRHSSPRIRQSLIRGLIDSGANLIDVGVLATPMLYFAAHKLETLSAVMVTGSHNPPSDNGLKIMLGGESLSEGAITDLRERLENQNFDSGQGSYREHDIHAEYLQAIVDDVIISEPRKVVVDCSNGASVVIARKLFEALGCTPLMLNDELDGDFPGHLPDPSNPDNLSQLTQAVLDSGADLGVAFDGDADRIGVVDEKGNVIASDQLLMLFARDLLSRNPGVDVVYDVKCSRHLAGVISENGGRPVMWMSGHSLIKEKMKQSGALLGGEFTGHICFRERWYGFDDALYCSARLLEILGLEGLTMSEVIAGFPHSVSTPEIFLPVEDSEKFQVMDKLSGVLQFDDAKIITVDGLRVEYSDGWGLLRPSNTVAALTLRFEADNEDALERIKTIFRGQLSASFPNLPF